MFGRFSLGKIGLTVGGILTLVGFAAYFTDRPTLNLIGFFYGVPILLGGLALIAAELPPVSFSTETPSEVLALREQQATETQTKVLKDVTRYRYGQSTHLESSLEALRLGDTDDDLPILMAVREEAIAGAYALILEFDSEYVDFDIWQARHEKLESFFGPGISIALEQPETNRVDLKIIAQSA
ncbi:MAG: DUF2854 domain-containing protein [Cyanobacteria bacterium J06638_20]